MPKTDPESAKESASDPIVLRWHAGSVVGALFDEDLDLHTGKELLDWVARGIDVVVVDHATGQDITRIFLAHWKDGRPFDPVGSRHSAVKA
ncbi:MAG TPA: hypothetical protein VGH49_10360 [Xanthobacteraceae bacterium]